MAPATMRLASSSVKLMATLPWMEGDIRRFRQAVHARALRYDFGLAAQFDDAVDRDAEELGRVERHVRQQDEQLLERQAQRRSGGRATIFSRPTKERGFHQVEAEAADPALRQRARDVGLLEEAVADRHGVEILVEMVDLEPLGLGHPRHVLGLHRHQHVALVQHLVVLHVVQQRRRHVVDPRRSCRSPVPGTRAGWSGRSVSINVASGKAPLGALRRQAGRAPTSRSS